MLILYHLLHMLILSLLFSHFRGLNHVTGGCCDWQYEEYLLHNKDCATCSVGTWPPDGSRPPFLLSFILMHLLICGKCSTCKPTNISHTLLFMQDMMWNVIACREPLCSDLWKLRCNLLEKTKLTYCYYNTKFNGYARWKPKTSLCGYYSSFSETQHQWNLLSSRVPN